MRRALDHLDPPLTLMAPISVALAVASFAAMLGAIEHGLGGLVAPFIGIKLIDNLLGA
jgi:high-affinity K+ transport system ATPase subunit B